MVTKKLSLGAVFLVSLVFLNCPKKKEDNTTRNLLLGYVATQSLLKNDVCNSSTLNTTGLTTTPTTLTLQVNSNAGGAWMTYVTQSVTEGDFIQIEHTSTSTGIGGNNLGVGELGSLTLNQIDGVNSCANVPTLSDTSNRATITCYRNGQTIPSPYTALSLGSTETTKMRCLITKTAATTMLEFRFQQNTGKDVNALKPTFSKIRL